MEFFVKDSSDDHLTIVEDGLGFRALAVGMFLFGSGGLLMNALANADFQPGTFLLLTVAGPIYFFSIARRQVVLNKASDELRVERRRILPFTSSSEVIPLSSVVVPDVTFQRTNYGLTKAPTLHLLLKSGRRIKLNAQLTDNASVRTIHHRIWNFLELSPDEEPPDPFDHS